MSDLALTANEGPVGRSGRARGLTNVIGKAARKILHAVFIVWGAATIAFFIQALMPGDRATLLAQQAGGVQVPTAAQVAAVNEEWGFDKSLLAQYWEYISGLAHGDMGTSYILHEPVTQVIGQQIVPTLVLTVTSLALAWLITVVVTSATARRGRFTSGLGSGGEIVGASIPTYWLGVVLLVVFAINLGWFPVVGGGGVESLVLPAVTLAIPLAGFFGQITRDEFERTMDQPFVISARARGMSDLQVRLRHVLRHSVVPAATYTGVALGGLIAWAVLVETIFGRPGIGHLAVSAATERDVPVVTGIVVVVALVYVIGTMLVDLAHSLLDPRIKA